MEFPNDDNGDVFRRMREAAVDFATPHDVEFFAVLPTEAAAEAVAMLYVADRARGEALVNIETRPAEDGGMELELVKRMLLTHADVTAFKQCLAERVGAHGGDLDGWGVLQS